VVEASVTGLGYGRSASWWGALLHRRPLLLPGGCAGASLLCDADSQARLAGPILSLARSPLHRLDLAGLEETGKERWIENFAKEDLSNFYTTFNFFHYTMIGIETMGWR
jgi:hypothetical protein